MERAVDTGSRRDVWIRGVIMILFAVFFGIGQWLLNILAIVQFFWIVFTDRPNDVLAGFGRSLGIWLSDVARFLSCATDERPFPWQDWPKAP